MLKGTKKSTRAQKTPPDELDNFITEVEWSARRILNACNKKRNERQTLKDKREYVEKVKQNSVTSRSVRKFPSGQDLKSFYSRRKDLVINPQLSCLPSTSMVCERRRQPAYPTDIKYTHDERSEVLKTLKGKNTFRKKNLRRKLNHKHYPQQKSEIDWSIDVLRKKYRCVCMRGNQYQEYVKADQFEHEISKVDKSFVSSLVPQKRHPIVDELLIGVNNVQISFSKDTESLWSDVEIEDAKIVNFNGHLIPQLQFTNSLSQDEGGKLGHISASFLPNRQHEKLVDTTRVETFSVVSKRRDFMPAYIMFHSLRNENYSIKYGSTQSRKKIILSIYTRFSIEKESECKQWLIEIFDKDSSRLFNFCLAHEELESYVLRNKESLDSITNHAVEVYSATRRISVENTSSTMDNFSFANAKVTVLFVPRTLTVNICFDVEGQHVIRSLQTFQIVNTLQLNREISSFDVTFWASSNNKELIWLPLVEKMSFIKGTRYEVSFDNFDLSVSIGKFNDQEKVGWKKDAKLISTLLEELQFNFGDDKLPNKLLLPGSALSCRYHQLLGGLPISAIWYGEAFKAYSLLQQYETKLDKCEQLNQLCPGYGYFNDLYLSRSNGIGYNEYRSRSSEREGFPIINFPDRRNMRTIINLKRKKTGSPISASLIVPIEEQVSLQLIKVFDKRIYKPNHSSPKVLSGNIPLEINPSESILINPALIFDELSMSEPVLIVNSYGRKWANNCHSDRIDFDDHGFRKILLATSLEVNISTKPVVYGISENAVTPNKPSTLPPCLYRSEVFCMESLTRRRTSEDIAHLLADEYRNKDGGKWSVPCLYTVRLAGYSLGRVERCYLSEYNSRREKFERDKERINEDMNIKYKIQGAERIFRKKLAKEVVNIKTELGISATSSFDISPFLEKRPIDSGTEPFFEICLSLDETSFSKTAGVEYVPSFDNLPQNYREQRNILLRPQKSSVEEFNPIGPVAIPRLHFNPATSSIHALDDHAGVKGKGWRHLPDSVFGIDFFELNKRNIDRCIGDIFFSPNSRSIAEIVKPEHGINYVVDESRFLIRPEQLFIEDVVEDMNRHLANKERREREIISNEQKTLLSSQEIAHEAITQKDIDVIEIMTKDEILGQDSTIDTEFERNSKCVLAAKNGNLPLLERLLNIGADVDTADEHGSTLFILSCQQGNKRLAKFLLRRGAFINAQNVAGHSALHYLYEYGHSALAEYLKTKGADDRLLNAQGMTCYEGLHMNNLDDL